MRPPTTKRAKMTTTAPGTLRGCARPLFSRKSMICIVFLIVPFRVANRKIDNLLSSGRPPSSALARLINRASQQDAWTDQLRALLPQELASECRVANVRDQILTVHIGNAAWATRFRFLIPSLLESLVRLADFTAVTDIRLKVVPVVVVDGIHEAQHAHAIRPPDRVPLLELANGIDDAGLRETILRLAAHGNTAPPSPTVR